MADLCLDLAIAVAVERPAVVRAARDWVAECTWRDDPADIARLSDEQILRGVDRAYAGGLAQFLEDAR